MDIKKAKEIQDILPAAALIALFYLLLDVLGIGCPIKYVTGISCLGCGMTRAWLSILRFDLKSAIHYHPAFWLPPLVLLCYFLKSKINIKIYNFFIFTAISIFVIIYVVRLAQGNSDIVVFRPENNILFRVLKKIHTRGGSYVL